MEQSMRWKRTERKYTRLRNIVVVICLLYLVYLSFLVKYAMSVNPGAFMYNPMIDEKPPFEEIRSMLGWIVIAGWLAISFLFYKEVKKNPKHWFWKVIKELGKLTEEIEEERKQEEEKRLEEEKEH